jgi:hypothetical protein
VVCVLTLLWTRTAAQVVEVNGDFKTIKHEALNFVRTPTVPEEVDTGVFRLATKSHGFALALDFNSPENNIKTLLVSDGHELFQSFYLTRTTDAPPNIPVAKGMSTARATFEKGRNATRDTLQECQILWTALQIAAQSTAPTEIEADVVPKFIKDRIAREHDTLLRILVLNRGKDRGTEIQFWQVDRNIDSPGVKAFVNDSGHYLIGDLEIQAIAEGIPTKVYFVANTMVSVSGPHPEEAAKAKGRVTRHLSGGRLFIVVPGVEVFYSGSIGSPEAIDLFTVSAYGVPGNMDVGVLDFRSGHAVPYTVRANMPPPFHI